MEHTAFANSRKCPAILFLGMALILFSGCAKTAGMVKPEKTVMGPVAADVDPAAVKPGLAVLYIKGSYRHIDQMPTGKDALKEGEPGKPIPFINHRFGSGEVFDSGLSTKVGVQMTGFIRFPAAGRYLFKAKSNDGIRVYINNAMVIDDPKVHLMGDQFSGEGPVEIAKPGWYPFLLQFFQRKGTSMLELYWQAPGAADFSIIPADAYGHIPASSN